MRGFAKVMLGAFCLLGCERSIVHRAGKDGAPPSGTDVKPPSEENVKVESYSNYEGNGASANAETVTLRLAVSPPVKAEVFWGNRRMGQVSPGKMEAEWIRQRDSGPLDLQIRAEGYLPRHTRLYTDRDDKVLVRLLRPPEAASLWGYHASEIRRP